MADWSSTTQVITDEQEFYQRFGLIANMRTMDYLWKEITRIQKELNALDRDHSRYEYKRLYDNIYRNLNIHKHLYPILKKQHDANRSIRTTLSASTYQIRYYGRERTVCDPS